MAVRTEQAQVLEPVVLAVTVDVVQRQREGLSAPLRQSAPLAVVLLEPGREETRLEVSAIPRSGEEALDRHRGLRCTA